MKKVSFRVAKAIKEAGYPQLKADWSYGSTSGELVHFVDVDDYVVSAPTYLDVWLWLWREKKWFIKTLPMKDKFHYQILDHHDDEWHSWGMVNMTGYDDPEDAIEVAVEYLIDNKLLK